MDHLQISSEVFFELFPFHMVFKRSMMIVSIGEGLQTAMKNIVHESVKDVFHLHRPLLPFTWDTVWIFTLKSKMFIRMKTNSFFFENLNKKLAGYLSHEQCF